MDRTTIAWGLIGLALTGIAIEWIMKKREKKDHTVPKHCDPSPQEVIEKVLREILHDMKMLEHRVDKLEKKGKPEHPPHPHHKPKSSSITFLNAQGEPMPLTVKLNDTPGRAVYQEYDGPNGTGSPVPPTGTVAYSSDNGAVATVDVSTGALTYVGIGSCTISANDGGSLPASDTLTVEAAPAVSSTLTFEAGVTGPDNG